MNELIIEEIAKEENITTKQVTTVLQLLSEGNTIPFIARYRKEMTNALDEEQIRKISDVYEYQLNLAKRKEDVIRLIDEKGLLTEELKENILKCNKLVEIEDLYRPYKEKKKTKATEAIKLGLEPLAKIIMSFPTEGSLDSICKKYINEKVKDTDFAIEQASYIISEWISDNAFYRKWIRSFFYKNGTIISKKKKSKEETDPNKIYEMYYDFNEPVAKLAGHRVLAVNRGENEKILTVKIEAPVEDIIRYLEKQIINDNLEKFTEEFAEMIKKIDYYELLELIEK
mgnify:CR=1 FL=1